MREREGLSYSVQSWLAVSSFEANSPMILYAIFAPENRERVRAGIDEELARALKDGFTEAEVTNAKARAAAGATHLAGAGRLARRGARAAGPSRAYVGVHGEESTRASTR